MAEGRVWQIERLIDSHAHCGVAYAVPTSEPLEARVGRIDGGVCAPRGRRGHARFPPSALALRERIGGIPFPPTFSRPVWLAGLVVAVAILAAMTPFIRPGRRWAAVAAYAYGVIHMANAIGHVAVSVSGGWLAPGVMSSPVLLAAALWLLYETSRSQTILADTGSSAAGA